MRQSNRGRTFPKEPLERHEVAAILAAPSRRAPSGIRNRALLAVLHRTGLRVSEVLDLGLADYDARRGSVLVRCGKGGKTRIAGGLTNGAADALERWLAIRPAGASHLFCTLAGTRLSPSYVRDAVKRYARRAGITKRVHPHAFRHTHTRELVEEGFALHLIRDQLGHTNIATTNQYIAEVAPEQRLTALGERA